MIDYNAGIMALGTDQGSLYAINTGNFDLISTLNPPRFEQPEATASVEVSLDRKEILTIQGHHIVIFPLPSDLEDKSSLFRPLPPKVYMTTTGALVSASVYLPDGRLAVGDALGGLTVLDSRNPTATLQITLPDQMERMGIESESMRIMDIFANERGSALKVIVAGAPHLIHVPISTQALASQSGVDPWHWNQRTRYSLEDILVEIYLRRHIFVQEFSVSVALGELQYNQEKLQKKLALVKEALASPQTGSPTLNEAYRILRYAEYNKIDLSQFLQSLSQTATEIAQILQRSQVYDAVSYLLDIAQARKSNFTAFFEFAKRTLRQFNLDIGVLKETTPSQTRILLASRWSTEAPAFWLALTRIQLVNPQSESIFWELFNHLLTTRHPVDDARYLSDQELLDAMKTVLYDDRHFGDHSFAYCRRTLDALMGIIAYLKQPYFISNPYPSFTHANAILLMAHADGRDWRTWMDARAIVREGVVRPFDDYIPRLEAVWWQARELRALRRHP